jgi:hypothetical protein
LHSSPMQVLQAGLLYVPCGGCQSNDARRRVPGGNAVTECAFPFAGVGGFCKGRLGGTGRCAPGVTGAGSFRQFRAGDFISATSERNSRCRAGSICGASCGWEPVLARPSTVFWKLLPSRLSYVIERGPLISAPYVVVALTEPSRARCISSRTTSFPARSIVKMVVAAPVA